MVEESSTVTFDKKSTLTPLVNIDFNGFDDVFESTEINVERTINDEHYLTSSYEKVVNIFGRFQQEAIALGLSELR